MGQPVLFQKWAPPLMAKLMADFNMTLEDAAAVVGNWGLESGGFRTMQETNPLSGRGGLGIAQWTGPRRVNYERWLQRTGTTPTDFNSSYAFAWRELTGQPGESNESRAVPMVKNAVGLENKVKAFELGFERAHKDYKHYPERLAWAKVALAAYQANPVQPKKEEPVATVLPVPQVVKPDLQARGTWAAIITGLAGTVGTILAARNPVLGATWESLSPFLIAGVTTVGGAAFSYIARRTAQGPLASAPVAKQAAEVLSPAPFVLPEQPVQSVVQPVEVTAPITALIANAIGIYDQVRPLANLASPFVGGETPLGKVLGALPEIDKHVAQIRAQLGSQGGSTS